MSETTRQSVEQLRGEIAFRAKLARQHVSGEVLLPDYLQKDEHDRVLLDRIDATRRDMATLTARQAVGSPFVELGAERGQRSLVLVNDFGAEGIATDISYHQLRTMDHFAQLFGFEKLPLRVCCDANQLPFRDGSIPFLFCYQFLHHFPSLRPIIGEIQRVMGSGYFYFAEEPYRRVLRVPLYRQQSKIYSRENRQRNQFRRLVESFISTERSDETEHGVIENDDLSLSEWIDVLRGFDASEASLESIFSLRSRLRDPLSPRNLGSWLLGGLIRGMCYRAAPPRNPGPKEDPTVWELLVCPRCAMPGVGTSGDQPCLERVRDGIRCPSCKFTYPIRDDVIFLIAPDMLKELYPEVVS